MELSKKQKAFSDLFAAFLEFTLNIKHFQKKKKKKLTLIVYVFSKLSTSKDVLRQMSRKSCFSRSFDRPHCKQSQTLLKSEGQHPYHNYFFNIFKI